jgi:hypothetical protein
VGVEHHGLGLRNLGPPTTSQEHVVGGLLVGVKVGILYVVRLGFAGVNVGGVQCGPRASRTAVKRAPSCALRSRVNGTRLATAHLRRFSE